MIQRIRDEIELHRHANGVTGEVELYNYYHVNEHETQKDLRTLHRRLLAGLRIAGLSDEENAWLHQAALVLASQIVNRTVMDWAELEHTEHCQIVMGTSNYGELASWLRANIETVNERHGRD